MAEQDLGRQPSPEAEKETSPKTEEQSKGRDDGSTTADAATEPHGDGEVGHTVSAESGGASRSSKSVVFVLGGSGKIGSATLKFLSEKFVDKVEIRAGVRHPEGADQLKSLPGVTLVHASMADKDSLVTVLAGVDVLYIVTPGTENRAELSGIAGEAAKEAGVKHVVVVSASLAGLGDTTFGKQFQDAEGNVTGLGIPYTIIRLPIFMDNSLDSAATVKENAQFFYPVSGDKPYTVVDPNDAGKASAAVLIDPSEHAGKAYDVVSDRITNDGVAAALSAILGREVSFVKTEMEDAKQMLLSSGLPEWRVDGFLQLFELIEEGFATR